MKKILLFGLMGMLIPASQAQVAINTNGAGPDASAMLDIVSMDSGVLIPRMTAAQRDAIANPATGLLVYVSDDNQFYYYDASGWSSLSAGGGENPTNELQTISRSSDTLSLSDGGGFVSLITDRIVDHQAIVQAVNDGLGDYISFQVDGQEAWRMTGKSLEQSSGDGSISIGNHVRPNFNALSSFSTYIGSFVANSDTNGQFNVAIGNGALRSVLTPYRNVAIGADALRNNTNTSQTVAIGYRAGRDSQGSGNVFIGYTAGQDASGSNKLYIENSTSESPLIYGEFDNDLLRINGALDINNAYTFPAADGTANQTLTTDGSGNVSWATPSDPSDINELQDLGSSANGTTRNITISNGSGTSIDVADNDNDPTNELDSKWTSANGAIHHSSGSVGIGTSDPDTLVHISSASTTNTTGIKVTQGTANSLLYHNADGDFIIQKRIHDDQLVLGENGAVGLGTDDPTKQLDVNGQVRIRGGSPAAGKVLTADDADGNASWTSFTFPIPNEVGTATQTDLSTLSDNDSTWTSVGSTATLADLENGDVVLVLASFTMRLNGGSGSDSTSIRIQARNQSNSAIQYSIDTGEITDLNRSEWVPHSLHRVFTISEGSGNYRFTMQLDGSLTDDFINIDQQEITAILLK